MWFYVVLAALFSVYALDLLALVVVSLVARAREAPLPDMTQEREAKVGHVRGRP